MVPALRWILGRTIPSCTSATTMLFPMRTGPESSSPQRPNGSTPPVEDSNSSSSLGAMSYRWMANIGAMSGRVYFRERIPVKTDLPGRVPCMPFRQMDLGSPRHRKRVGVGRRLVRHATHKRGDHRSEGVEGWTGTRDERRELSAACGPTTMIDLLLT